MDNYNSPLVSIQNQIDGIRSDIYGLNAGLTNVGVLLRNDRVAETIRLREEEQQERILAQQQVKVGKETEIEKRVTQSISVPIQKVESKLTNTFSGISEALKTLFFGTLSTLGIRSLGFTSTILRSTINGTKSLITNALRLVTGALSSIGSGFGFVYRSVTGLTKKVSDIAFRLVSSPIKAISDGFKSLLNIGKGTAGAAGSAAAEVSGAGLSTFGKLFKGLVGPAAAVGVDVATGEKPEKAIAGGVGGTAAGALTGAAVGSVFGPPGSLVGGIGGYMLGSSATKGLYDKITSGEMNLTMPGTSFNVDVGKAFGEGSKALMGGMSGMFDKPEPKKVNAPITTFESVKDTKVEQPGKQIPLQVQPAKPPTQKKDLTPPEQKPDVIYTSTVAPQEQQQPVITSPENVPFIPSSNSDNFYVLYSQLNYNVVI